MKSIILFLYFILSICPYLSGSESSDSIFAIIVKHTGITDKYINPFVISLSPISQELVDTHLKIYNKYIPNYKVVILSEDVIVEQARLLESFLPEFDKKSSISFGSISVTIIFSKHYEVFYFNDIEKSKKIIISLFKSIQQKSDISPLIYMPIELFYCSLAARSFPCITDGTRY